MIDIMDDFIDLLPQYKAKLAFLLYNCYSYHLLLYPETSSQNACAHLGLPCSQREQSALYWTQIACSPSRMQSSSGHTLYFVADLTHIICIYSGFIHAPSYSLFFSC